MKTDPFEYIEEISGIVYSEMSRHPKTKYPTQVLDSAREDIARDVRLAAYSARKELEELDNSIRVSEIVRETMNVGVVSERCLNGLDASEVLKDWLNHLAAARIAAQEAKRDEVAARHELWSQLAKICDEHLGLGEDDWAFG